MKLKAIILRLTLWNGQRTLLYLTILWALEKCNYLQAGLPCSKLSRSNFLCVLSTPACHSWSSLFVPSTPLLAFNPSSNASVQRNPLLLIPITEFDSESRRIYCIYIFQNKPPLLSIKCHCIHFIQLHPLFNLSSSFWMSSRIIESSSYASDG